MAHEDFTRKEEVVERFGDIRPRPATGLARLEPWQLPLVLVVLMLAISLPAVIIAAIKLNQRTIGPLLEANGWAINGRVHINIPFGTSLTALPDLPAGAHRSLVDPYAEKKPLWPYVFVVLLLLGAAVWAWNAGYFS